MIEFFNGILSLTFWEIFADVHGLLAMTSLVLFGGGIFIYFAVLKNIKFVDWLKKTLLLLFVNLALLDTMGLIVYVPYRAKTGPRTFLKASETLSWLHTIIFEHKEFMAFAPMMIVLTAFLVVKSLGKNFNNKNNELMRKSVLYSMIVSLLFLLIVAAEAVLVTKTAPVR